MSVLIAVTAWTATLMPKIALEYYSRIGTRPVRGAYLEARRFEKVEVNHDNEGGLNMVETVEELVEGENRLIDDVVVETDKESDVDVDHHIVRAETDVTDNEMSSKQLDEVANDETDIILDDMWSKHEDTDHLQWVDVLKEHGSGETRVMETDDVEVKKEVSDKLLTSYCWVMVVG
ncbi:hypothetical protein Tco_0067733 [Tanacetum coccineum]